MVKKSGLAWKLRGFPYMIELSNTDRKSGDMQFEWCIENLDHKSWVRVSAKAYVFSDEETAVMFQIVWAYDMTNNNCSPV